MTKKNSDLMFIKYVGNTGGTAMARAIKEYANKEFADTIIDEYQRNDIVDRLKKYAEDMAEANPKWKAANIELGDNTCGGRYLIGERNTIYFLRVDGETILTIIHARYTYAWN